MQDASAPAEPTGQIDSSVDVDALVHQIENTPSHDIPMSAPPKAEEKPAAPATPQEYEFTVGGKQIKAPLEKILRYAQQGYDAPTKIGELNQKLTGFEKQIQQYQNWEQTYKPIDEFARSNPEWWNHVTQAWEQRQQALDPANPIAQEIGTLKSQLSEFAQFKQSLETERLNQQRQAQDQELNADIKSIRESYPNLDFDAVDNEGKSLELRILEHANKTGTNSFRAAFRDFYHDHLVKLAEERGKELVNKDIQRKTKLGFLGQSSAPRKVLSDVEDLKSKTYEQLAREALEELGVG